MSSNNTNDSSASRPQTSAWLKELEADLVLQKQLRLPIKRPTTVPTPSPTPHLTAHQEATRVDFEIFVRKVHRKTDPAEIYNAATIIDYVCRFIEGCVKVDGAENVNVASLEALAEDMKWWIVEYDLISDFGAMELQFDTRVSRHIQFVTDKMGITKVDG